MGTTSLVSVRLTILRASLGAIGLVLAIAAPAASTVIYDNGAPDLKNGWASDPSYDSGNGAAQADQFILL